MFKKMLAKRKAKKAGIALAKREAQVLLGVVLFIATHKLIQKAAKKYPALRFARQ